MDGHASAVVVIDLSCRIDSCTETPDDPVDEVFLGCRDHSDRKLKLM